MKFLLHPTGGIIKILYSKDLLYGIECLRPLGPAGMPSIVAPVLCQMKSAVREAIQKKSPNEQFILETVNMTTRESYYRDLCILVVLCAKYLTRT